MYFLMTSYFIKPLFVSFECISMKLYPILLRCYSGQKNKNKTKNFNLKENI